MSEISKDPKPGIICVFRSVSDRIVEFYDLQPDGTYEKADEQSLCRQYDVQGPPEFGIEDSDGEWIDVKCRPSGFRENNAT